MYISFHCISNDIPIIYSNMTLIIFDPFFIIFFINPKIFASHDALKITGCPDSAPYGQLGD